MAMDTSVRRITDGRQRQMNWIGQTLNCFFRDRKLDGGATSSRVTENDAGPIDG